MAGEAIASSALHPPLNEVLEARSHNLDQDTLIFDPSPERDSAIEIAAALVAPNADVVGLTAELITIIRKLAESNAREGCNERAAAGALDALAKSLHQHGHRSSLTVKAASRKLRSALRILGSEPDAVAFFRASCEIRDVIAALPVDTLYGPGLRHELGQDRSRQLARFLGEPEAAVA